MTLMRPTNDAPVGASFLGYQEATILNIKDRADEFDWADVYVDVILATPNSKYSTTMRIKGSYKRNTDNTIDANSKLVKDIYSFFDAIGYTGGIDNTGTFCNNKGEPVSIESELSSYISGKTPEDTDHEFNLYVYVYKDWNIKRKKAYTTVHNYIQPNTEEGREKCNDRIEYLLKNGFLKEATSEQLNSVNGSIGQVTTDNVLDSVPLVI